MPSVPAGARHRRRQLRVDRGLGGASRLEQRLGGVRCGEPGAEERSRLPDQGRQGRVVPAGHGARDRPGAVDENRRRHRDQPVGAGRLVRRVLGGDLAGPAEAARHPDGDLERVLEDGGGAEPGLLPCPAQRAEPAQGHRGGGAILVDEQQERAAARGEGADGDLAGAGPADGQRGRRMRAGGAVVAAVHPPPYRSCSAHPAPGWFPPRQRVLAAYAGMGPVPRAAQDRHGGQSPGENVARSVDVRVIAVAALLAPEHRLAIAVDGRGVAAYVALLRGETRINVDDGRTGRGGFVLGPLGEQPPAGAQDGTIQPGLGPRPIRQETAPMGRVRLGPGFAHHARRVQFLEDDQVVIGDQAGGDLLRPVAAPVGDGRGDLGHGAACLVPSN